MSTPTRIPLGQISRHILRETTRENIDPQPSRDAALLQNELDISNLQWEQTCGELEDELKAVKDQMKAIEDRMKAVEDQLALETNFIIRLLMEEMIQTIERQLSQKRKKVDEVEEKQEKTCKFI